MEFARSRPVLYPSVRRRIFHSHDKDLIQNPLLGVFKETSIWPATLRDIRKSLLDTCCSSRHPITHIFDPQLLQSTIHMAPKISSNSLQTFICGSQDHGIYPLIASSPPHQSSAAPPWLTSCPQPLGQLQQLESLGRPSEPAGEPATNSP
jgi:hypothetical protein